MASDGYPSHPRATGNRLKARTKYDYDTVHHLIDTTPILHVSFPPNGDDPFPATLPMLGCTGPDTFDAASEQARLSEPDHSAPGSFPTGDEKKTLPSLPDGPRCIYLHGHSASRLFQVSKGNKLPVTIAASSMQGIVLALTPFHNSCNYSSAIVHGYASLLDDEIERNYALTRITDNLLPERWDNSRVPPTKAELTTTGVIKVEIESASAKVRVGGPGDDRADLKNEELVGRVWTGVVPCWTQYGTPVPSSYNKVPTVPGYISSFVKEENDTGKAVSVDAIQKSSK
ncbi:5-nitroimidazole antibiotic resistance protein [Microthyrium microscopicum]|uniref:5-nitroimidazole antibiotic resistance protein n=1 Tax=Microthyrium microscopicum TaxID=703497 RepID=A0A6A6UAB2_9PEZI|nr:5-nitroimidazole antibiotic resistance protein [Microthyrium microscopicum]